MANADLQSLDLLHKIGTEKHLPDFTVYVQGTDSVHINERCGGTPEVRNGLDVELSEYDCEVCFDSSQADVYYRLRSELSELGAILLTFEEGADPENHPYRSAFGIVIQTRVMLQNYFTENYDPLSDSTYLYPLADTVKAIAVKAEKDMVAFLHSAAGRSAALEDLRESTHFSSGGWDPYFTHLLLDSSKSSPRSWVLSETFGRQVTPTRHLVSGPTEVMVRINDSQSFSSPLRVGEDTTEEALIMAAALWEPQSDLFLGDAQNALRAAELLVLK